MSNGFINPAGIPEVVDTSNTADDEHSTTKVTYTVGALPTGKLGQIIYVTDAYELAKPDGSPCFWNGTSWIDFRTGVAAASPP